MMTAFSGFLNQRSRDLRGTTLTASQRRTLAGARNLAELMDNKFSFLGFRFGLDTIVGLVPGVGDAIAAAGNVYLLGTAVHLKLPPTKLARMATISAFDFLVGLVPFFGDLADTIFKSHMRNLRIIEEYVRTVEGNTTGRLRPR